MRYGIAFEGGGGKGAYEIGVWSALEKLNLCEHFSLAVGTSVGGLVAALFSQHNLDRVKGVWKSIHQGMILPLSQPGSSGIFSQNGLAALLRDNLDPFHTEDMPAYVCFASSYKTGEGKTYEPRYECLNYQRTQDDVIDCLLSSAAIPVVFPNVWAHGRWRLDGGVLAAHNLPYKFACERGCERVLAVSLSNQKLVEKTHVWGKKQDMESRVLILCPSRDIGGILGTLNFSAAYAKELIELGEHDCLVKYRDQILSFFDEG